MALDQLLRNLPALFAALVVAILFIQSGLDKVFDWKGNLGFLTEHFSKTFVASMVPMMLATITVMELATGFLAAAGIIYFLVTGSLAVIFWASVTGAATIAALLPEVHGLDCVCRHGDLVGGPLTTGQTIERAEQRDEDRR